MSEDEKLVHLESMQAMLAHMTQKNEEENLMQLYDEVMQFITLNHAAHPLRALMEKDAKSRLLKPFQNREKAIRELKAGIAYLNDADASSVTDRSLSQAMG